MAQEKDIAAEWNSLETDYLRWEYIKRNPDKIVLMLDNDGTYVDFHENVSLDCEEDCPELKSFDAYIGNADGLDIMLSVFGIQAHGV